MIRCWALLLVAISGLACSDESTDDDLISCIVTRDDGLVECINFVDRAREGCEGHGDDTRKLGPCYENGFAFPCDVPDDPYQSYWVQDPCDCGRTCR